jgi:hypothetical protein
MLGSENGSRPIVGKPEVAEILAPGKLTGYVQRWAKLSRAHVLRAFSRPAEPRNCTRIDEPVVAVDCAISIEVEHWDGNVWSVFPSP